MTEILAELQKGGVIMVPLLIGSILALAIVIERAIGLRSRKILVPEIITSIKKIRSHEDVMVAERICEANEGPFANIVLTTLQNQDLPRDELKDVILDQGRQEVRVLERGLVTLETIAAASPLLGLMGTVIGMIKTFNVISQQGVGQASVLSGGISEALITTVTGLAIGIPALVAFNYFTNRAESLVLDIEKHSATLLQKFRHLAGSGKEGDRAV